MAGHILMPCGRIILGHALGIFEMNDTSICCFTGVYLHQVLEGVVDLECTGDLLCSCISDLIHP